jgi:hypothetical protein
MAVLSGAGPAASDSPVHFRDVTRQAGIHFLHNNGAFGKKYLPETLGPGVAFIDCDKSGYPSVFLVNGMDWPGHFHRHSTPRLYHNNGDGTFTDVTHKAGLDVEMYGLGVAVGDYDNDGYDDIFVTALGQSHLFHNNGGCTFTDVTEKAGLGGIREFSTSAAWVDYDRDGYLDLVVGNYVQWSPETDLFCTMDGRTKSYCTPESYKGSSVRLWHNRGNGTFEDVTRKAGLWNPTSKTLGVAVLDYDNDGWPDLFFANDTEPNKLYHNNRNGTFTEQGVLAGVAFSEEGAARAGMGVDAADFDRSGHASILVSNFSNQMVGLYHNEGKGLFVDEAPRSEVGRRTLLTLGFACFFLDYDLDGWPDIFVADGHIDESVERIQGSVRYAESPHLFRNLGNGKFEDVTEQAGKDLATPRVARGAAYADIDNEGRLDLLISTNHGPVVLLHSEGGANSSLRIKLVGTKSNRDGLGTLVRLVTADGAQSRVLCSGSSYLSSSELVLTFGLGRRKRADSVEIHWPSGQVDRLGTVAAGQTITVTEGRGVTSSRAYVVR